jgi:mannosyltransferase OCH1-like enzyme
LIVRPEDFHSCLDEFPGLRQIWDRISPWIVRSDLARLLYVYRHGGFYLDSDCEIFTKLPKTAETVVLFVESIVPTSSLGPREDKSPERRLRIANYAFGSSVTRHAFFKECIEECMRRLNLLEYAAKTQQDVLWGCGPDVITSVYHAKNHSVNLLGRDYVKHRAMGSWRS